MALSSDIHPAQKHTTFAIDSTFNAGCIDGELARRIPRKCPGLYHSCTSLYTPATINDSTPMMSMMVSYGHQLPRAAEPSCRPNTPTDVYNTIARPAMITAAVTAAGRRVRSLDGCVVGGALLAGAASVGA